MRGRCRRRRRRLEPEVSPFARTSAISPTSTRCSPRSGRSEEHTSELQSQSNLVCRLLLDKKSTDIITPLDMPATNKNRVLINLHGGGFISDSGSLIEGIPIASLAKIKVVSVYYRLAPENPFPAAVDDVVAVYKELLKTYKPKNIGIFGTSAGAVFTAEGTGRFKRLGLPMPGALGIFSGTGDFSRAGDSLLLYTLEGFPGELGIINPAEPHHDEYVGKTNPRDAVLSPLFADLKGWPA